MKGMKILDGARVRLCADLATKGGTTFQMGEIVTFKRAGVVRGMFRADDGRIIYGNFGRHQFEVLDKDVARKAGYFWAGPV